ncbi:MAG: heparinase II/III family protein [Prevotella sp.]
MTARAGRTIIADTTLLQQWLVMPAQFHPLPIASEEAWQQAVPQAIRTQYILSAQHYSGKPWPSLPLSLFAEFRRTGTRASFEKASFAKRRQLAMLAMGAVMQGGGPLMKDVADGLWSLMDETWWGVPAHYKYSVPMAGEQTVDLFNAETASLMAWVTYMLRPQLDSISPEITLRVERELQRRILQPALKHRYWWKTAGMNWNPWICSNWLTCVLLYEKDRERQLQAVKQIMTAMQTFVDAYPADGGCDEGPDYWDRAAASLYECLRLLSLATEGRINHADNPKIRAMMAYAYHSYIGNGYCVNFADAHKNRMPQQLNVTLPMAQYFADETLKGFAAYIAEQKQWKQQVAETYLQSGNFPALGRELFFALQCADLLSITPREPLLPDVWLPQLQVMTARRGPLFVAAKGGHNNENHNHNDVGSFIVYAHGKPILADAGVGTYTATTFSKQRYTIWTMQSQYHNLPQINGFDQHEGRDYAAKNVKYSPGCISMDLAGTYPAEAGVKKWVRTIKITKTKQEKQSQVVITDKYALDALVAPTRWMLVAAVEPHPTAPGEIALDSCTLHYHPSLSVTIEPLEPLMDSHLKSMWQEKLYRIILTGPSARQGERGIYEFTIKSETNTKKNP